MNKFIKLELAIASGSGLVVINVAHIVSMRPGVSSGSHIHTINDKLYVAECITEILEKIGERNASN